MSLALLQYWPISGPPAFAGPSQACLGRFDATLPWEEPLAGPATRTPGKKAYWKLEGEVEVEVEVGGKVGR